MELGRLRASKIYEIIEQIRRFPTIWDTRCREYKDTHLKAEAFQTIASELKLSVEQVKEKYRNLRTYYVKERKKLENRKRSNPNDAFPSKWEYFDPLDTFMGSTFRYTGRLSYNSVLSAEGMLDEDCGESSEDRAVYGEETERPELCESGLWFKEEQDEESWDTVSDSQQDPLSPPGSVSPSVHQSVHVSPSPVQVSSSVPPHVHVSPLVPQHTRASSAAKHGHTSSAILAHPNVHNSAAMPQNIHVSSSVPPAVHASPQPVALHVNDSLGHSVTRQVQPVAYSPHSVSQESTDSLFGQIVARQLATLPEGKKKELLKLKIQKLVFETQFEDEASESDSTK